MPRVEYPRLHVDEREIESLIAALKEAGEPQTFDEIAWFYVDSVRHRVLQEINDAEEEATQESR